MVRLVATDMHAQGFTQAHFGGNILATRDGLGADGTYDEAADYLDLGSIRYPGGSLTERYFDLSDPDRTSAPHHEVSDTVGLLPFSEFMSFAEVTGREALIVLPTRTQLSDTFDDHGDRFAAIDEDTLRGFIRDTLDGTYGSPKIAGFELGNEYWDSGEMNSVEYGRVASEMAAIVHDEITSHPDYEARFQDTDILVQMGMNYGHASLSNAYDGTGEEQLAQFMEDYDLTLEGDFIYSNGKVAWPQLANHLVMREFDLPEEIAAIDGVVAHVYSRGEDMIGSHYFSLRTLDATWGEDHPELDIHVTEWNVRNRGRDEDEDFGLVQSREMLDVLEAMSYVDAESAYVYPVQQRSPSSLTGDEDDTQTKVSGEFFRMMHETLPGTRPVVLDGAEGRDTELVTEHADIHAFAGEGKMVFYVLSTEDTGNHSTQMDVSALFTGFDAMQVEKLGVAPGDAPGSATATPVRSVLNAEDVYREGVITADLGAREILQITVEGAVMPADTAQQVDAALPPPDVIVTDDLGAPDTPAQDDPPAITIEDLAEEQEDRPEADEDNKDDDTLLAELLGGLGLLPLLVLGIL